VGIQEIRVLPGIVSGCRIYSREAFGKGQIFFESGYQKSGILFIIPIQVRLVVQCCVVLAASALPTRQAARERVQQAGRRVRTAQAFGITKKPLICVGIPHERIYEMIQTLKQKKLLALVAPMGLAAALAFAPTGASAGFLTYGDSQGVVNSYKECWQAEGGMAQSQLKGPKECLPDAPKVEKITATLSADVLFEFDKAVLKPAGVVALDELAEKIKSTPGNEVVNVIGHTDPIGSFEYNLGLSNRRADAVTSHLRSWGVNVGVSKGMSFKELVVECPRGKSRADFIACNQPNRRAVITAEVVSPDAPTAPAKTKK